MQRRKAALKIISNILGGTGREIPHHQTTTTPMPEMTGVRRESIPVGLRPFRYASFFVTDARGKSLEPLDAADVQTNIVYHFRALKRWTRTLKTNCRMIPIHS